MKLDKFGVIVSVVIMNIVFVSALYIAKPLYFRSSLAVLLGFNIFLFLLGAKQSKFRDLLTYALFAYFIFLFLLKCFLSIYE